MFQSISPIARWRLRAAVALSVLAAACTDQPAGVAPAPVPAPDAPGATSQAVRCTVTVSTGDLACATPSGAARAVYGGQDFAVRLTSSGAQRTGNVFEIGVTVTNLLDGQAIGTVDGVTQHADGVRVFFDQEPVATDGGGAVSVANADGEAMFNEAQQPYFQYAGVLAPGATSGSKPWRFALDPDVHRFTFEVLISTEVQARLVISEIMANPDGTVQDSLGEYVEVYNAGLFPVNLRNFSVRDNGGANTISADVVVPAKGYALLGRVMDPAKNGGLSPAYAYAVPSTTTNLTFSNSGADRFMIRSPAGVTLDSIAYTASGTVARAGIAREVVDLAADNTLVDGANWTDATKVYDAPNNNRGTPGVARTDSVVGGGPSAGPVVTVSVTPSSQTLAPGLTRQYTATGRDANGVVSATTWTWASSNPSVATVSATGVVTTVADGSTSIQATSANGVTGSTPLTVFTPSSGAVYRNHVAFGTPADANAADDILLNKPQFSLSYNAARGGPNWVSWNLNASHFGDARRCDCFLADSTLPAGTPLITHSDYTGSGYSRGHMVMSEQRTATPAENAVTFRMTNILPQIQDMNGGPWLKFEVYTNDLARVDGKEVYNIAGGVYSATPATLNGAGRVAIPTHTWKIIVVMNGGQGLADVTSASSIQVIAVNMPNVSGIQANDWPMYRTSVDAIEALTGYDFLASLPDAIEAAVEAAN